MSEVRSRVECAQESVIPSLSEEALEAKFECPICLQCLDEAVLTSCGHRFCRSCIDKWLQRDSECPVDSQPLRPDRDVFPDNFTRREIQQLLRTDRPDAERDEEAGSVECSFREVGCTVSAPRGRIAEHLEKDMQHHLNLLSVAYSRLSTAQHQQQLAAKAQEAEHLWSPDPKQPSATKPEPLALVRSLYERVVVLEQRDRELDIQLAGQRRQFSAALDAATQELSLRHCGGTFVWRLPRFSATLAAMRASPSRCSEYSPGFYTAPCGYRFCARLNLSQKDHGFLALLVHLTRGDNDALLAWPFTGCISFELASGAGPRDSLRESVVTRPDLQAFHRPLGPINPKGFGYTEFVSLAELEGRFLPDDVLTVRLCVQSVK
ncbi:TNF receptor-associated factor 6-like [Bacillus rossius redtenbacheri]|uniref:TNF receptor-associated factor 6-like n=1 Tax=Bacillus rossius redtenbacheri TaxID=93214 RepID=UPI002FDD487E